MAKPVVGSTINTGHALGDAICLIPFNEGSGSPKDLVSGAAGTLSGASVPTWDLSGSELGIKFNGGAHLNSYITFGVLASMLDFWRATPGTILIRGRRGTSAANGIAGKNDDNATTRGWQISTITGPKIEFASESTGNMYVTIVAPADSTDFILGVKHDGSLTGANLAAFLAGAGVTETVVANGSGSKTSDSADPFRLGTSTGFTAAGSFDGLLYQFVAYARQISDTQMSDFASDPWAMLNPPAPIPQLRRILAPQQRMAA